jgi:hypothetical protein
MRKLQNVSANELMNGISWPFDLEHVHTSYLLLGMLVAAMVAAGVLFQLGLIGLLLRKSV